MTNYVNLKNSIQSHYYGFTVRSLLFSTHSHRLSRGLESLENGEHGVGAKNKWRKMITLRSRNRVSRTTPSSGLLILPDNSCPWVPRGLWAGRGRRKQYTCPQREHFDLPTSFILFIPNLPE